MQAVKTVAALVVGGSILFSAQMATAASTVATYPSEVIGPFDSYDLSAGSVALLKGSTTAPIGQTYEGVYQGHVNEHLLNGSSVFSSLLNNSYEITAVARYTGTTTAIVNSTSFFNIGSSTKPGAGFKLLFDDSPDRDLVADSGYTDSSLGTSLLEGDIIGGSGAFTLTPGGIVEGLGFTTLEIAVTATAPGIFNPDILSVGAILRLTLDEDGFTSGITSVLGETVEPEDLLIGVDADLELSPVPLPAAAWLFIGAMGLVGFLGRKKQAA